MAGLRINQVRVKNFKSIEDVTIAFPAPELQGDPDVFVIGSKNGVGKTSLFQAISYVMICLVKAFVKKPNEPNNLELPLAEVNRSLRSGCSRLIVEADLKLHELALTPKMEFTKDDKGYGIHSYVDLGAVGHSTDRMFYDSAETFNEKVDSLMRSIHGTNPEPLLLPHFMFFNSYRQVREGNMSISNLVGSATSSGKVTESLFKSEVLRALMSQGGLFEDLNATDSKETLDKLNGLVREFAGGYIDKLRPTPDNTMEFRITPVHGGATYSFDALSSGQKEIISTLFMIWHHTKNKPSVVLIDEPELHLNSEWHRPFVRHLVKMAPQNQYILATHSEDIFASVDPDHRILISVDQEGESGDRE